MKTHILSLLKLRDIRLLAYGAIVVTGSFALGIQSAGEVQPIELIEAGSIEMAGDVDGSGHVDLQDVISILEVSQGYREPTPELLRADPNGDGILTVDDALEILSQLALR